jgi:hypothetical protein
MLKLNYKNTCYTITRDFKNQKDVHKENLETMKNRSITLTDKDFNLMFETVLNKYHTLMLDEKEPYNKLLNKLNFLDTTIPLDYYWEGLDV